MSLTTIIVWIGGIIFLGYIFSQVFERTSIPDVLPLFLVGLGIGPLTGWVTPDELGRAGDIIAILTLTTVLFVGGLNIKIRTLVRSFPKTSALMLLNLVGTTAIIALAANAIFGVSFLAGTIVGILLGGTSSAVVIPIARRLNLCEESRTILAIESDLNDIFSVTVALALVSVMQQESVQLFNLPGEILASFVGAVALGAGVAIVWSRILTHVRLLCHNIYTTPALLLMLYGSAEYLGTVGPIAILTFGITIGNLSALHPDRESPFYRLTDFQLTDREHGFFSSLVFLFKTFFFVYLGIVMPLNDPRFLLWGAGIMIVLYALRYVLIEWLLPAVRDYDRTVMQSMLPKGLTGGALLVLIGDPLLSKLTYPVIFMSILFTAISVFAVRQTMTAPKPAADANGSAESDHG